MASNVYQPTNCSEADLEAHMNELHDAIIEAMLDNLPYEFKDIDEWNAVRDQLFAMLETLDSARFTK